MAKISLRNSIWASKSSLLLGLMLYPGILLVLGVLGWGILATNFAETTGIDYGEPLASQWASVYPLGVNVTLEQYDPQTLQETIYPLIKNGGFRWIRQTFPWAETEPQPEQFDWARWDLLVETYPESGARLIAVLDTSPAWARDEPYPEAPPRNFEDFFNFVRAFAERYGEEIDFYQIWDEPNIYPRWGERFIDPFGYTHLLQGASLAIREVDTDAVIMTAGLAPNIEAGGRNMSDIHFLEEMYRAGAGDFFDILAIQPYGFWGEADDPADPEVTNFSRALLLRQVMLKYRDGDKSVWAVEFGWNALPDDWTGQPSPWSSDVEEIQAQRTVAALERATTEWPWMGAMILMHLQPDAPPDDPIWGFSLLNADYSPRLLYQEFTNWSIDVPLFPGRYSFVSAEDVWGLQSQGEWKLENGILRNEGAGSILFSFQGTRLDLILTPPFQAEVEIDGQAGQTLAVRSASQESRVTLAKGLTEGEHTFRLSVAQSQRGGLAAVIVRRDIDLTPLYLSLGLIAASTIIVSLRFLRFLALPLVIGLGERLAKPFLDLPEVGQGAVLGGILLTYYFSPWLPLDLMALAIAAGIIYLRPDWGLFYVVFSTPFYLLPKDIVGKHFSMVETITLITIATWTLRGVLRHLAQRQFVASASISARLISWLRSLPGLDWAVIFFLGVGLLSLAVSEVLEVSLREFRVVILEPVIFYFLLRTIPLKPEFMHRMIIALILAAAAISVYGLFQYLFTTQVITAEGARRIYAVYGSPNNLALFLMRVLPLLLALVFFLPKGDRRTWHLAAAVLIASALFLTYSRGALFLGVPAAVLLLAAMKGRRFFVTSLAILALALLLLIPLTGSERFASLLDLQSGTGFLRLQLWQATLDMIRDHPVLGVGLDNFLYQYPRYLRPAAAAEPDLSHPHNLVLHFLVSLGIPGLISFIWMLAGFFREAFRLLPKLQPSQRIIVIGLIASVLGGLAHGLVDQSYFLVDLAFLFFLNLGLVRRLATENMVDH